MRKILNNETLSKSNPNNSTILFVAFEKPLDTNYHYFYVATPQKLHFHGAKCLKHYVVPHITELEVDQALFVPLAGWLNNLVFKPYKQYC
jgi:hypothetical protein